MNVPQRLLFCICLLVMNAATAEQPESIATVPTENAQHHSEMTHGEGESSSMMSNSTQQHSASGHVHGDHGTQSPNHNVIAPDAQGISTKNKGHEPSDGRFALERLQLPQVTLIDQEAQRHAFPGALTDQHLLVINFTYTHCETVCPVGNQIMAQLDDVLDSDIPVTLLSISIDPARDTPQRLNEAAQSFGASARWYWLGGDVGEVKRLLAAFDADQPNFELHEPLFLVGDLASGSFYRSQSIPQASELAALVETLAL